MKDTSMLSKPLLKSKDKPQLINPELYEANINEALNLAKQKIESLDDSILLLSNNIRDLTMQLRKDESTKVKLITKKEEFDEQVNTSSEKITTTEAELSKQKCHNDLIVNELSEKSNEYILKSKQYESMLSTLQKEESLRIVLYEDEMKKCKDGIHLETVKYEDNKKTIGRRESKIKELQEIVGEYTKKDGERMKRVQLEEEYLNKQKAK